MPQQNSLPTWSHTDLDTLITLLADSEGKIKLLRKSPNLPSAEREQLDEAFDDVRLAKRFALKMRERQEDIVEVSNGKQATPEG